MEPPSQRQLRVGEQLRHIIAETLQRGKFDDIVLFESAQNVTVSEVRISPDLKHATAYVMALGGKKMDTILPALNESSSVFQKEFARKLQMRFTPRVRFVSDDTFEEAEKIEKILLSINPDRHG